MEGQGEGGRKGEVEKEKDSERKKERERERLRPSPQVAGNCVWRVLHSIAFYLGLKFSMQLCEAHCQLVQAQGGD